MKRIIKTHSPIELQDWITENREYDHSYEVLVGSDAHRALKAKLLSEQGFLCAYTGRLISLESSHIEHIKPQNCCEDWEDVNYMNVVACIPANGGDKKLGYGAPLKDNWWDADNFISPLSEGCDHHFVFSWKGYINEFPDDNQATITTIKVLGLDNEDLRKLRLGRIRGFFGFGSRSKSKPLAKREAEQLVRKIDVADSDGKLKEFCFVLKQLLPKYIAGNNR